MATNNDVKKHSKFRENGSSAVHVPHMVAENIRQLIREQKRNRRSEDLGTALADRVTDYAGTPQFLIFHVVWFGGWLLFNGRVFDGIEPFDPYPFGFLTFVVSLEAIFLSTFVLIAQSRLQKDADRRAELDLHVNLLAEREATTILKKLVRIEESLGIEADPAEKKHVRELVQDTNPVDIIKTIQDSVKNK
jgi:uncharacterized membrane protein